MLEKPDIQDEDVIACLQTEYGLHVDQLDFLPLGADVNSAVYRAVADNAVPYFVKVRQGVFDEILVALPRCLKDQGIPQIIAPLETRTGQLWADLGHFKLILYPFIEGRDGYQVRLSDRQRIDLGTALKRIHTSILPPALSSCIRRETFSAQWRNSVMEFMAQVGNGTFDEAVAADLASFLNARREQISDLLERAGQLARVLQARSLEFVLCHSDLHPGNILVATSGGLYVVDWDNPILAPKEQDLIFFVGRQEPAGGPDREEGLFHQGYGPATIDPVALAYYRHERIIEDIAAYCQQLLLTDEGDQDREQSLRYLKSSFLPGGDLEIALASDDAG